ncbi:hypothetical protein BC829DRAFT_448106 [Chytridium lagenaria]|nr:hypothetical protein BC829DRAFT_448106 [Chytridium lagenaria]
MSIRTGNISSIPTTSSNPSLFANCINLSIDRTHHHESRKLSLHLSWALVATTISGSPPTNNPSLSRRSKAMSVANNPLSRRGNPLKSVVNKVKGAVASIKSTAATVKSAANKVQGAANTVGRGVSAVGGAVKAVDSTMKAAKTAIQDAGLAAAAKGHECNSAMRHLVSGASACCPAYHSCISTRRDAGQCGSEYNACKAGRKKNRAEYGRVEEGKTYGRGLCGSNKSGNTRREGVLSGAGYVY